MARDAGLADITLTEKRDYVDTMTGWNDPLFRKIMETLPPGTKMSEFVTSLYVTGKKSLA
jgi:hypothetical protein